MADSNLATDDVQMFDPGVGLGAVPTPPPTHSARRHPSPRPGPDEAGSSKRKRGSNSPEAESPAPSKRPRKPLPNKKSTKSKEKKPSDWHLRKTEIPKDAKTTKTALELHIRTLWGLTDQNAIPPTITARDKAPYTSRFSNEAQVKTSVTANLDRNEAFINEAQSRVDTFLDALPKSGVIAKNIGRIPESSLLFMFRMIACSGLRRWAPDVLSNDPDSMFNLLHEHIALTTFEQVASAFTYSHMAINLSVIRNFVLMRKFYRSFVFSYMHEIAQTEAKKAGARVKSSDMKNVKRRRIALMNGRVEALKAQGFRKSVVDLARDAKAHSDDELVMDGGELVYHIKEKTGRAAKVKNLFRLADELRRDTARSEAKGRYREERQRVEPHIIKVSELPGHPKGVPIDYFDPVYWNTKLSISKRAQYIEDGIRVALPKADHCETLQDCAVWRNYKNEQFMTAYGNDVAKEFVMPTKTELKRLEDEDADDESDEDEDEGEDEEEGEPLDPEEQQVVDDIATN